MRVKSSKKLKEKFRFIESDQQFNWTIPARKKSCPRSLEKLKQIN